MTNLGTSANTEGQQAGGSLVYSIVVNYKSPKDTRRCLKSLSELNYPDHEFVLVNNDDDSESASSLSRDFPECTVIVTGENLGFSSGFNVGIKHALDAGADYVSILNNDVILREDFLKNGVRTFDRYSNVGMVGGKIYKYDSGRTDYLWSAGGYMSWLHAQGMGRGVDERDRGQYNGVEDVSFIPGSQMLVRREVFEEIGLLPSVYFLGGEEWDFCLHVRRAGYRILYNSDVVLWHEVGHSGQRSYARYYNHFRNKLVFMQRGLPYFAWTGWLFLYLLYCHSVLSPRYWRRGDQPRIVYLAAIHALRDHYRGNDLRINRTDFEKAQQKRL